MNKSKIDLNLLIYLDVLLREQNVTRAAAYLNITQPAMSNGLKRLRELFKDPLLVRTSAGMMPTDRALALAPLVHEVVTKAEQVIQPRSEYDAKNSKRVFRIAASDYAESALLPNVLAKCRTVAPNVCLDILNASDVGFSDVELGKVDLVINRFDSVPESFYQKVLWEDDFSCLLHRDNPVLNNFNLDSYLEAKHVWVSKTGMGVGSGMTPESVQRLGWVDEELRKLGHKRNICVFTRSYQSAVLLAEQKDLVVTLPSRATHLRRDPKMVKIKPPPFAIAKIQLRMAWSPILQNSTAHRWLRELIVASVGSLQ